MNFFQLLFKIKSLIFYYFNAGGANDFHSPFIFDFYNEVILAKKEFYVFNLFRSILSDKKYFVSQDRIFFLFRWVHFYKPKNVYVDSKNFPVSLAMGISCLNKELQYRSLENLSDYEIELYEINNIKLTEGLNADLGYFSDIDYSLKFKLGFFNCLIIENPHKNKTTELIWNELCQVKTVSVSIDLLKFGILLINRNQVKEHFVVKM